MMTFKQLEAVFWVVEAGGFAQAAARLHTTQSAVSKRVQELEAAFDTPLFDRRARAARLTEKGEEMYGVAKRLLEQRDAATEQFQKAEVLSRHLRIGITELTAMTWLARLIAAIHARWPRVVIEPYVDSSATLRDRLLADQLDLIIVPDIMADQRFTARPVGAVEHAWMCKPGMSSAKRLDMADLGRFRLLTQDDRSGTGLLYNRLVKAAGLVPENTVFSSSLVALIGLTISGLGLSYLPRRCLAPMIDAGVLDVLTVRPALPAATYAAMHKADVRSSLVSAVAGLAEEACDFAQTFQLVTAPPAPRNALPPSGAPRRRKPVTY